MKPPASSRQIWLNRLQAALTGLVAGSIIWTVSTLWQRISQIQWHLQWAPLAVAVVLLVASLIGWAFAWSWMLGNLEGQAIPLWASARFYIYANAAKYIPGSVWNFFARAYLGGRAGRRPRTIWTATLFEFAAGIFTGLLLYAVSLIWPHTHPALLSPVLAWGLPALLLILISPPVINRLANVLKKNGPAIRLKSSTFLIYLFLSIGTWVLIGSAFWLFLTSLDPAISTAFLPEAIGLWSIAVAAGMAAVGFPQGIGVKEAVLVFGLGFSMPLSQAVSVALLSRAWIIAGDLLALATWWIADRIYLRLNPNQPASNP